MAAPNLNSTSLVVNAGFDRQIPSDTAEHTLTGPVTSGQTWITTSMTCTNVTSGAVACTVNVFDATNNTYASFTTLVAAFASFNPFQTPSYLLEGYSLKVTSATSNAFNFQHHYLKCS